MKTIYKVVKSTVTIENTGYTAYGIECYKDNILYETFNDISLNKEDVYALCDYLRRNNISSVHFFDIVEDYLAKK